MPNTIEDPDVVLVEAAIKRRFPSERFPNGRSNYDVWSVKFELRHVALLAKASKETVEFSDAAESFEV